MVTEWGARDENWRVLEPDLDPSRPPPIPWPDYVEWIQPRWDALLAGDPHEREIQEFLERNPAYVPGANRYGSGHHSPHADALFAQPNLKGIRRDRRPDFMWIGATSGSVTPVLIEITRPAAPAIRTGEGARC